MENVFCVDIVPKRLEAVEQFGATPLNGKTPLEERIAQIEGASGRSTVDAVIEVAGVSQIINEGIAMLRHGGHYVFVGAW